MIPGLFTFLYFASKHLNPLVFHLILQQIHNNNNHTFSITCTLSVWVTVGVGVHTGGVTNITVLSACTVSRRTRVELQVGTRDTGSVHSPVTILWGDEISSVMTVCEIRNAEVGSDADLSISQYCVCEKHETQYSCIHSTIVLYMMYTLKFLQNYIL